MIFYESFEHKFMVKFRHFRLLLHKARRNELAHLGTTPEQMGVLRCIQELQTPPTIIELRKVMMRSNSSLVAIIKRMERKGLIERYPDSQSKKYTRVLVTGKGKELYERAMELNAFKEVFSDLSMEDMQRLSSYIETLTYAVEKTLEEQRTRIKPRKRKLLPLPAPA